MLSQKEIRDIILKKRQQLSAHTVQTESVKISQKLIAHRDFSNWRKIAVYFSVKNEIDLYPFILACWEQQKEIYMACVNANHTLNFRLFNAQTKLIKNHYHIPEPITDCQIAVSDLDLLILPLVAFDKANHRIGMGGGYYDRTLCFKKDAAEQKPHLMGVAYHFQKIETFEVHDWDIPLNEVIIP